MPRGKNYVNNHKGVFLQAGNKSSQMVDCFYGAGCTRPGCIYRHPKKQQSTTPSVSKEPCMAFLGGICSFQDGGCRRRHPPKQEAELLVAKYQRINCRFGDKCLTKGCLYRHPRDGGGVTAPNTPAFVVPTLVPNTGDVPSFNTDMTSAMMNPSLITSSWKPARPGLSSRSAVSPSSHQTSESKSGHGFTDTALSASAREWKPSG